MQIDKKGSIANKLKECAALNHGERLRDELKEEIDAFIDMVSVTNLPIKGYCQRGWTHFDLLPSTIARDTVSRFRNYSNIFRQALERGIDIKQEQDVICHAMWSFGLYSKNDLSGILSDEDVIEIYNLDGIQIFRNLKLFSITNYTILDLISYGWYELYERSSNITSQLTQEGIEVTTNLQDTPIASKLPWHFMKEKFSESKPTVRIKFKYFCPLHDKNGNRAAFLVNQSCDLILPSTEKAQPFLFGNA